MGTISEQAVILRRRWETDPRWAGIERTYSAEDVIGLRGPVMEEHTLARLGVTRLRDLLHSQDAVSALGAISASQAADLAEAGPQAIYLANSSPATVREVSKALLRADRIAWSDQGKEASARKWLAPVVADAKAGAAGVLSAFELMTAMIEAGAAGVCFEDQASSKEYGGKVLVPVGQHIKALNAARLAADVLDVPALVIARTAAAAATLLTSDDDERDHEFLTGGQTAEGLHQVRPSLYACVTRGLAFAPYADLLWMETETPDLAAARVFAQIIHSQYPDKMLAYSCSPSCDPRARLEDGDIAAFQKELAAMGYRFQSVTPAGSRALGTRYFDLVTQALASDAETASLTGSLAASVETAHFVGHDQVDHHGRLVPAD